MTYIKDLYKFVLLLPHPYLVQFMGPVAVFFIAFASIALFACFLQLFITFRKSGDLLFLISAILSLVVFIYFSVNFLLATTFISSNSPFVLLRGQLILTQIMAICMLSMIIHMISDRKKIYNFINTSALIIMLIVSFVVPDEILFGEQTATRSFILPHGDHILLTESGTSCWRVMINLTILLFVISSFVLLYKKLGLISLKIILLLFSGLGVILIALVFDQLIDLGQIYSTYILPFAFFIFYILLVFIPFVFFIGEVIDQQEIIRQEKKWLDMVKNGEFIVVGLNRMGHVEFINPYFFKLTGYTEEEVQGKDWFEFFIPPKDYYKVQGAFVEVLESDATPSNINPILTKNNEEVMIHWVNVRNRNHLENITGSLSIGVDVTHEISVQSELQKKLEEAENLIADLSRKKKNKDA